MDLITVDADKCKKDGMCVAVCPSRALELAADGGPAVADAALCNACGHCVAVCPHGALVNSRVEAVDPDAPLQPASRDWPVPEAMDRLLRGRRSIRAYADKPVARQVMEELLDVARYAPTASNVQEIRWTATVDPKKVHELAALTAAWFAGNNSRAVFTRYAGLWEKGLDVYLRGAPALVVVHTDASIAFGPADCGIALTFFELAAVSRGLGTCWAGLLTYAAKGDPAVRQALGVPEGHTVHGGLMLGYPKFRYAAVPPRNPVAVRWL
ncbi:nitroreductase [Solidesulfovibrio fructosivorans JJ]]|uniref:Nitroreductase n=1 Tax=Solidesulfovibrio fructosivorans JJ] TaxID=596151 RepID=E1K2G0_SOLFR|nr:nitroreductase family protein [Solidesulfovibrio fructosivorans]EFL49217.1 nitroreductase [Solidesulfovibrio fructosivorans JJ]]